jgi:hypothetical protein
MVAALDSRTNIVMVLKSERPAETDNKINVSVPYREIYHTNDAKHTSFSRTTWLYTQVAINNSPTIPPQIATSYFPRARKAFFRNDRIAHSTEKAECINGTMKSAATLADAVEMVSKSHTRPHKLSYRPAALNI